MYQVALLIAFCVWGGSLMAKGKSPSFSFYPDAWLASADISLMTPAEEGAYIRLLAHSWQQTDCGSPSDDATLAVLSRLGKMWPKSRNRVLSKFEEIDGRYFNQRLLEERAKQEEWRRKSAEGGKNSATKRQPPFNHPSKGGVDLVEVCLQPNVKPREEKRELQERTELRKESLRENQLIAAWCKFTELWQLPCECCGMLFPWKDEILAAQLWISHVENGTITDKNLADIMAGLARWRASRDWHKSGGQFVQSVATFLGYKRDGMPCAPRWNDRPVPKGEYE